MKKEYKFRGKIYTAVKSAKGVHHCQDCVFLEEPPRTCREFISTTGAPRCSFTDMAFKEKDIIKAVPKYWHGQSATIAVTVSDCKITAALMPRIERYIVCLIENGKLAPSTEPKQHNTRESADSEALRLCKLYHQEFAVLQVVSSIKPQEPKKEVFA